MGVHDWYRNETWDADTEDAFFTKLKRTRSQRDQYIVIQALTLARRYPDVCLRLVDLYFDQKQDDFEDVRALLARKYAYEAKNDVPRALEAMKAIVEQEQKQPKHLVGAHVDFPYFVACNHLIDEYPEASRLLAEEREEPITFPVTKFKIHAARAFIAEDIKAYKEAAANALEALRWAEVKSTTLRYHPTVGLVGDEYAPTIKRLKAIRSLNWFRKLLS